MTIRRYLMIALLIPYVGIAVGLAVSRLYWGYWLCPPSSDALVDDIASVERFTTMSWDGSISSGRSALLESAATTNSISGEDPRGRLPAALARRRLYPASPEPVDPLLLPSTVAAISSAGKLLSGSSEYPNPGKLHGHLVLATTRAGTRIALAALTGGEASNDHYPYYEATFGLGAANRPSLERLHFYYWDFAGLEGIAHWLAGVTSVFLAVILWLVFGVGLLIVRRRRGAA